MSNFFKLIIDRLPIVFRETVEKEHTVDTKLRRKESTHYNSRNSRLKYPEFPISKMKYKK